MRKHNKTITLYMANTIIENGVVLYRDDRPMMNLIWEDHLDANTDCVGSVTQQFMDGDTKVVATTEVYAVVNHDFLLSMMSLQRVHYCSCAKGYREEREEMVLHVLGGAALRPHVRRFLSGRMLRPTYRQEAWDIEVVDRLWQKANPHKEVPWGKDIPV